MRARRSIGTILAGCIGAVLVSVPLAAAAQPVVQKLPSLDSQKLTQALARLARNPRDIGALIDAGDAASGLGDYSAAIGFYQRADQISATNPRVKAGLAKAMVLSGDPVSALPMFAEAERLGAPAAEIAASRGLAYDLVGDNLSAQRHYKGVLGGTDDADVRMRLALSQAMAGDAAGSEATLMPLLKKQDKPGWRTRAFALAIAGDTKQAVDITNSMLPPKLAESIAPYLRYMPRLTLAQQAAAANLGKFPRASEIGHDDPRIAAWVASNPVARLASADAGLIPKGEPLGKKGRKSKAEAADKGGKPPAVAAGASTSAAKVAKLAVANPPRIAPPDPKPTIQRPNDDELPPLAASVSALPAASPAPASPAPATVALAPSPATSAPVATTSVASTLAVAASPRSDVVSPGKVSAPGATSGFDLAQLASSQTLPTTTPAGAVSTPAQSSPAQSSPAQSSPSVSAPTVTLASSVPTPPVGAAPAPTSVVSLAEIFADLGTPTTQALPKAGAVDISAIEPAKPQAAPQAKAKAALDATEAKKAEAKVTPKKPLPPSHPSRIWVQIGVGRDKAAIAFDWRRLEKQAPAAFKGRKAYISEIGRTNRILAGPFETQKAATQFLAQLKAEDVSGAFVWTSPAGQVVDALAVK